MVVIDVIGSPEAAVALSGSVAVPCCASRTGGLIRCFPGVRQIAISGMRCHARLKMGAAEVAAQLG